ncbi:MAG TPA: hypothetical protein VN436_03290 [Holophaga sp.]|nr:hypothetical protein [Holophaga sp.]
MLFTADASAPRLGIKAAAAWPALSMTLAYAYSAGGEGAACPD